jgi:hypothetical protein
MASVIVSPGVEVDFLVVIASNPILAIEVKTSDKDVSKGLKHFQKFLPKTQMVQLVYDLKDEFDTSEGIQIRKMDVYLASLQKHLCFLINDTI